jgi:hypothetical protein
MYCVGGMPLSPKAATTTVGSPPPYVLACSVTMPMPVAASVDSSQATTVSSCSSQPSDIVSILGGSASADTNRY